MPPAASTAAYPGCSLSWLKMHGNGLKGLLAAVHESGCDPIRKSPPYLCATATTDPAEWITRDLGCPWSSDRDLAPLQRRALPRAVRGAGLARHSFLRRSAARNKFYSPRRSVW